MAQECLGPSSALLDPPRHSAEDVGRRGPSTCPQHCPRSASPTRIISLHQAELQEPKRPAQLGLAVFTLQSTAPSPPEHSGNSYLTRLVASRTLQCPNTGIRDHWATRRAPQSCRGMATQPPAQPAHCKALQLQRQSSAQKAPRQAQVLSPEGRARDGKGQESPTTSLRLGISSHTIQQRHTSIILLAPTDHKVNSVPLHGITLSAWAHRSR